MREAWSWTVRILVIAVCVFLTAWSVRMAVADWRAQSNGMTGLESAIRLEPGDSVLLARAALAKNGNGDMSAEVDRELLRAAQLNPYSADVQMALGLREEFRGHAAEAERYLVHATDIDHTFKPAWTLANYYFRNDQPGKGWPVVRRAMALDPLVFDPKPVFDLCWNESLDSKQILDLIPAHGRVPVLYLYYLIITKRTDAALELWPRIIKDADPSNPSLVNVTTQFPEFLEQMNRIPEAVRVWNQMVDHGIIASGRLDPARGVSLADPDFSFPLTDRGFAWHLGRAAGVSTAKAPSALRIEFDGNEPESTWLVYAVAPMLPGRAYRLIWNSDASRLSSPRDPGLFWRIVQEPGNVITVCEPLLKADDGACRFTSPPGAVKARLELLYTRAPGTTRVEGALRITSVKMEFGS